MRRAREDSRHSNFVQTEEASSTEADRKAFCGTLQNEVEIQDETRAKFLRLGICGEKVTMRYLAKRRTGPSWVKRKAQPVSQVTTACGERCRSQNWRGAKKSGELVEVEMVRGAGENFEAEVRWWSLGLS